jgi:NAD-dependent dihydropyrimidine dehydrogenase PreA subunit
MPYIIAEPCINVKDRSCVDVCPVDCIYEGDDMLYIHPDECIDCGACEPECPVTAIFPEEDTPPQWKDFMQEPRRVHGLNPPGGRNPRDPDAHRPRGHLGSVVPGSPSRNSDSTD